MLEKIGMEQYRTVSKPCNECLKLIQMIKNQMGGGITFAEIGVGIGATAVEAIKLLSGEDNYYMFSYAEDVNELKEDLLKLNVECKNIHAIGNTRKVWDSYNWTLAQLYLDSEKELFDVVYLDGAHTFMHDSSACCLLKLLTKVGGYIIFDDLDWSYAKSPTINPEKRPDILDKMTMEQINAFQIRMVVDVFMKNDPAWQMVKEMSSNHREAYRRIK